MWYLVIVGLVVVIWLVADRPVLKMTFKNGHIKTEKGHCPPSFQRELKHIAEHDHLNGSLKVYQLRTGMKLVFSKNIPKNVQQHIRNVFPHQGFKSKGKKRA
ncbi:DUF3634 family protein [Vibrio palustris]|uniref:DUF3634 domain-containing protein n=1 Tax=Vibrio palustris TaxID=1918946 RepID=A0A1R4B2G9_9VIBR|nr:DUF3634 family protein [Vibrio palustris]SJL83112.1 hypothetical protein VPAL9027_01061 [Vibrio palustris]